MDMALLEAIRQIVREEVAPLGKRVDSLEPRFDNLESRSDKLESRFDNLESRSDKLESRFDNLESRFDNLETRFDSLEESVTWMRRTMVRWENEQFPKTSVSLEAIEDHEERITAVEIDVERHDLEIVALRKA